MENNLTEFIANPTKELRIYKADFDPIYPVGCCLIIAAYDSHQAMKIAKDTITHTKSISIEEVELNGVPQVIEYISGDY